MVNQEEFFQGLFDKGDAYNPSLQNVVKPFKF